MQLAALPPAFRTVSALAGWFIAVAAAAGEATRSNDGAFARATANGRLAAEGLDHCQRFLHAWLGAVEPTSGLPVSLAAGDELRLDIFASR